MAFYLQDSGSAYWQLGVTTDGREQNTSVGAQSIVPLVVQDSSSAYWQLGITTDGRLTFTSVGATATTAITLTDANGVNWALGVTTDGRTLMTPLVFFDDPFIIPVGAGWDCTVTVW